MADKSVNELQEATVIGATDSFVLEQAGEAKKLTGNTLKKWIDSKYTDLVGRITDFIKLKSEATANTQIAYEMSSEEFEIPTMDDFNHLSNEIDTLNAGGLNLKEDFIGNQVSEWLDDHPEATTTVLDGAITEPKISADFLAKIKNVYVTPQMFGAKADGVTDDTNAIKQSIAYCVERGETLTLSGIYYVTATIDTHGCRLVGLGTIAKPNRSYLNMGYDYINNKNSGASVTFRDFVKNVVTGSAIVSDTANPILSCNYTEGHFRLKNLSVVGWIRKEGQAGIKSTFDDASPKYLGGAHTFEDVYVHNCGGDGIVLQSLETVQINHLCVYLNNGYGLRIEGDSNHDTPFEYVDFTNCEFVGNLKDGLYAHNSYRKSVSFRFCKFFANGRYNMSGIAIPTEKSQYCAGVKIDGTNDYTATNAFYGLTVENCYGEECEAAVIVLMPSKVLNDVVFRNNFFLHKTSAESFVLLLDVYYSKHFVFTGDNSNVNKLVLLGNNLPMSRLFVDDVQPEVIALGILPTVGATVNSQYFTGSATGYVLGNTVYLQLSLTSKSEVSAFATAVTGFPKPKTNPMPFCLIDAATGDSYVLRMYQNNVGNFQVKVPSGVTLTGYMTYLI